MISTVELIRRRLSFAKPLLEAIFSLEARLSERWTAAAHRRLFLAQWGLHPLPEFFEHKIGLYWSWEATNAPHWVERGIFSLLAMKPGCKALELCCGDGFNAHYFYRARVGSMVSVDFDPKAIAYANKHFRAPNIRYELADIRTNMPDGVFDNVVWDAAIEHFTETEITELMSSIKRRLTPEGILSGFTIVERLDGKKSLSHHEYEFKSKDDLARFLEPHFNNVNVFETVYPDRHNLYFWASDGAIPFR
ncbi:methyltransferase domain-containing protein [Bradyrhizobium sp. LB11.1]|uniref:class I SAM-dependent methyltransferase n=1 Tax=Bradyrhizobium sp. LB11.1 TaxID=3156326 RepID=UPI0033910BA9